LGRFEPLHYEIRVEGHLDVSHAELLGNLDVRTAFIRDQPITLLSGVLADQAALYGVLSRLQALGMVLLSVSQLEPPA
jgi:hypothetical protein